MNKSFGKKILAVLAAAAIPFTTLFSSTPMTVNAADNYIYSATTKTSLDSHKNKWQQATLPDRSIAREDVVNIGEQNYTKGRTLGYTYTGNIYTANSSLYDYIADGDKNSFAESYTDPYVNFNKAIESTMNYRALYSSSWENLTIRYKNDVYGNKNIKVYLFGAKNNTWDGATMTYDPSRGEHVYTVKYDDLGFQPTSFIISGRGGDNVLWQSKDMNITLQKGRSYLFYKDSVSDTGSADDLYTTAIPLYFGCFYREYENNGVSNNGNPRFNDSFSQDISYNYGADNKGDKTYKGENYSNFYNNFYWQANMSFRRNYDGAVQGLVDNTLTDGTITQYGQKLPYFNDQWADAHSDLVKYWHNVDFPFYEVSIDADKVHSTGGNNATGKAIYYQFNSRKDNLYFDQSKGKYRETDTQIYSQGTLIRDENGNVTATNVRTASYLPFNQWNDNTGANNNLGFGTTFEINFKIRSDGKVDTVGGNGSVNATFEFMGDDDVWVFIDDKLVLDLGGDHKDTTGMIDFAEKKAYTNDATKIGYNSNTNVCVGMDNLSQNLTKQLILDLKDVMAEGTFNADGSYNEDMTHTLKMFYMERGMYESDLFVRFNFSTIPNKNTLKIREVTNFKDINSGLVDLTKQAADYDVFNYSVSNTGTAAEDVTDESGILAPTRNGYQRENQSLYAVLTGSNAIPSERNFDPTKGSAVANTNYVWTDQFVKVSGSDPDDMANTTDNNGAFNLMYGTSEKESSAFFSGQFKKGSYMYVKQNDSLKTVERDGNVEDFSSTKSRTVSEYYDTTVSIVDKEGYAITNGGTVTNTNYSYSNTSAVPAKDPVKITETFTNTPKVGALSVEKLLEHGDTTNDTFTFTVELTDIFGISEVQVTPDTYANVVVTIDGTDYTLNSSGAFSIKGGQTAVISGIPYGTKYTVTESDTSPNYQSVGANSFTGTIGEDTTTTVYGGTVTNTRLTNSLTLSKSLLGTFPTEDKDKFFTFSVTLTAPDGVDLSKYSIIGIPDGTAYNSVNGTYTFTVDVSNNSPVTITGIPYGTQYSVYEPNYTENWLKPTDTVTGTINSVAATAELKNTFVPPPEYGNLKVSKTVLDSDGSDITSDETFRFTVTLKNTSGKPVSDVFNTVYYLDNVKQNSGTLTFDTTGKAEFSLGDNESIVISDIPVGVIYTVVETANSAYDTSFDSNTGSVTKNTTSEVNFTNTKKFIPYTLPESGFEDTRMYFVFALSGMMLCGLAYWYINREKLKKQ